jgi:hypothetical protein
LLCFHAPSVLRHFPLFGGFRLETGLPGVLYPGPEITEQHFQGIDFEPQVKRFMDELAIKAIAAMEDVLFQE